MSRLFGNVKGNTLVLIALAMTVFLGFGALSIDVGYMLTAKNQLQNAVDAAALAGASGLFTSQAEAVTRAINYAGSNDVINQPVMVSASNVIFPAADLVQVTASRTQNLFLSRVLGINTAIAVATAQARINTLLATKGLSPWAIPDKWIDFNNNDVVDAGEYVGYSDADLGAQVVLKFGEPSASGIPSFFYPIDFPPVNRGNPITGANEYRHNITEGSQELVYIGDTIQVEPGNMTGPTGQGLSNLIAQDPGAYWSGMSVEGSIFPGNTSPRIIKIPFYDPRYPPDSGRNTITAIKLGAFFVEGISGKNVIGRFIKVVTTGVFGSDSSSSFLIGVKLVQ